MKPAPVAAPRLRVAALLGPTACGKTAAAVALRASGLPIEAVGCDALQLYRRLDAATAKPSPAERASLPYHLVDVAEPTDAHTAGRYAGLAEAACEDIISRGGWPLLVGGTGLYHRAFVRGLVDVGPIPAGLRQELTDRYERLGAEAMHQELAKLDPTYAATTPANNRQRVLRALEVAHGTGRPLSRWHEEHAALGDRTDCMTAIVEPDLGWLNERIEARARAMVDPLLEEVKSLLKEGLDLTSPAMQAIGYDDAVAVVRCEASADGLAARLINAHRKYAKRQRTWFRRTPATLRLQTLDGDDLDRLGQELRRWFQGQQAKPST